MDRGPCWRCGGQVDGGYGHFPARVTSQRTAALSQMTCQCASAPSPVTSRHSPAALQVTPHGSPAAPLVPPPGMPSVTGAIHSQRPPLLQTPSRFLRSTPRVVHQRPHPSAPFYPQTSSPHSAIRGVGTHHVFSGGFHSPYRIPPPSMQNIGNMRPLGDPDNWRPATPSSTQASCNTRYPPAQQLQTHCSSQYPAASKTFQGSCNKQSSHIPQRVHGSSSTPYPLVPITFQHSCDTRCPPPVGLQGSGNIHHRSAPQGLQSSCNAQTFSATQRFQGSCHTHCLSASQEFQGSGNMQTAPAHQALQSSCNAQLFQYQAAQKTHHGSCNANMPPAPLTLQTSCNTQSPPTSQGFQSSCNTTCLPATRTVHGSCNTHHLQPPSPFVESGASSWNLFPTSSDAVRTECRPMGDKHLLTTPASDATAMGAQSLHQVNKQRQREHDLDTGGPGNAPHEGKDKNLDPIPDPNPEGRRKQTAENFLPSTAGSAFRNKFEHSEKPKDMSPLQSPKQRQQRQHQQQQAEAERSAGSNGRHHSSSSDSSSNVCENVCGNVVAMHEATASSGQGPVSTPRAATAIGVLAGKQPGGTSASPARPSPEQPTTSPATQAPTAKLTSPRQRSRKGATKLKTKPASHKTVIAPPTELSPPDLPTSTERMSPDSPPYLTQTSSVSSASPDSQTTSPVLPPTPPGAQPGFPQYFQPVQMRQDSSPLTPSPTADDRAFKPGSGQPFLERLSPAETEQVYRQWQGFIRDKYPDLHARPYCVPPVHFNRLSTKPHNISGTRVERLDTDGDSNLKDDDAQRRLVSALYAMARQAHEVMFIMSSVTFDNLLKKPITIETPVPGNASKKKRSRKKTDPAPPSPEGQGQSNPSPPQRPHPQGVPRAGGNEREVLEDKLLASAKADKGAGKFSGQVKTQGSDIPAPPLSPTQGSASTDGPKPTGQKVRLIQKGKAEKFFPAPSHLDHSHKRGDLDVFVVHRHHGLVVMEIKAVGGGLSSVLQTPEEREQLVRRKLEKCAEQLDKGERVLRYVTSGENNWKALSSRDPVKLSDSEEVNLRKVIAFPNIQRDFLRHTLSTSSQELQERLQKCLGCVTAEGILTHCLCEDDVPAWCDAPADVTAAISGWWARLTDDGRQPRAMSEAAYEDIISRFCGKHSMVTVWSWGSPKAEVRTLAEAVYETGRRFCMLLLHPRQMEILDSPEPRVFVHGPPGSGKTLLLVLKGVEWARQGRQVYVLTGGNRGVSVSNVLYEQIAQTLKQSPDALNVHKVFITLQADPDEEVNKMARQAERKPFGILVDECWKPVSSVHMVPVLRSVLDILAQVQRLLRLITGNGLMRSDDDRACQDQRAESAEKGKPRSTARPLSGGTQGDEISPPLSTANHELHQPLSPNNIEDAANKGILSALSEPAVSQANPSQEVPAAHVPANETEAEGHGQTYLVYQQPPEATTAQQVPPSFHDVLTLVSKIKSCVGRMKSAQKLARRDLPEEVETLLGQILDVRLENAISDLQNNLARLFPALRESVRQDFLRFLARQMTSNLNSTMMVLSSVQAWTTSVIFRLCVDRAANDPLCSAWAVGVWEEACPEGFAKKTLRNIVRCPPSVQQVLAQVEQDASQTPVARYTYLDCSTRHNPPLPADGPDPTYLEHSVAACGATSGRQSVFQCYACGNRLGRYLTTELRINGSSGSKTCQSADRETLGFSDVIISGNEARCRPDSPFVRGLGDQKVPVKVMIEVKGQEEVAQRLLTEDKVVITDTFYIHGLERKVVVYVPDVQTADRGEVGAEHERGDNSGGSVGGDGGEQNVGRWQLESHTRVDNLPRSEMKEGHCLASSNMPCLTHSPCWPTGCTKTGSAGKGNTDTASASTKTIEAGTVSTGTIDTGTVSTRNKDTGTVSTGTIDTGTVSIGNKDTGTVSIGTIDTGTVSTGTIDTGTMSTGTTGTGTVSIGNKDTGTVSIGNKDTGTVSIGNKDTGTVSTGNKDTGTESTGTKYTGTVSTGNKDTGTVSTGNKDTGTLNTGNKDTGTVSTGTIDTGTVSTGTIDTGTVSTGNKDTGTVSTGTIHTGSVSTGNAEIETTDTGSAAAGSTDALNAGSAEAGKSRPEVPRTVNPQAMDARLAAMGGANRQMLWYVLSRSLAHAVIFHFGART